MPDQYTYAFDPHGTNPANKITDERQSINPSIYRDYVFIMPRWAPFFENSLVLRHYPSGVALTPEVDWVGTHVYLDASHSTATRICGSFSLKNQTSGVLSYDYQTIGGKWTISEEEIIEIISNTLLNPRTTTWEQVTGVPEIFPVIEHNWRIDDLVGAFELMESIDAVAEAINQQYSEDEYLHAQDTNNPHGTTALQVGAYSTVQMDLILEGYQPRSEAIANSLRLGGLTLAQLRQAIYEDGVSISETLEGNSWSDVQQYIDQATVENARRFGGMDYAEFSEFLKAEFTTRLVVPRDVDAATQTFFKRLLRVPNNSGGVPYTAPFQFMISGLPSVSPATLGQIDTSTTALVSLLDTNVLMSSVVALHDTLKPNYLYVEGSASYTDIWYRVPIGERCPELTLTFLDNRPRAYEAAITASTLNKDALQVHLGNRALVEFLRNETELEFITLIDTLTDNFDSLTEQILLLP